MRQFVVVLVCLLASCGGGGAGGAPPPTTPAPPPGPDLVLLLVSGHVGTLDGDPSLSYLDDFFGPALGADLIDAGYTVDIGYYVDHPTATDAGGYVDLVADMQWIRDNWVRGQDQPTQVIVVAHSHGGAWATAAIRAVPDLPVRLQVALDHSSYGWGTVGHDLHDAVMGGDPRNQYEILAVGACAGDDGLWNDESYIYDLEDVVFPNVAEALEVRAGEAVVLFEPYDEKWNVRLNATFTGMFCYYSATDHNEVRRTNGTTYPIVVDWILDRLAQ